MTIQFRPKVRGALTGLCLAIWAAAAASAQDRDEYLSKAKNFGMDIGYASFCALDGE